MGHLRGKYSSDYFLGGVDPVSGREYGVVGHEEFKSNRIHDRHVGEFRFLVSFVGDLSGKDILDIGCGRGDLIPLFLREKVRSYHGVDFSPHAIAIASSRFNDPKVRLEVSEAVNLKENASYDVIVMYNVIEHIPVFEMEVIWQRIRELLRSGGHVFLSTPIFSDANSPDHTELSLAVMGLHCHKQTLGTILRTCLQQGFLIGKNEGRCFGLFRKTDLAMLPADRRAEFVGNHEAILLSHGLRSSADHSFTDEEIRSLVPGAGRLLIGCVAENNPRYFAQALRLVQSLRWFGGSMAGTNIMVCLVDDADPAYAEELRRWGAFVRIIPRFSYLHPHSNKLRLLELAEVSSYDTIMLMDCDTIIVQDALPHVDGHALQGNVADGASVHSEVFEDLFQFYQIPPLKKESWRTFSQESAVWYCNTGVLIFPQPIVEALYPAWRNYNANLARRIELLKGTALSCEQASLTLAYAEVNRRNPIPFKELSPAMNFPLHLTQPSVPVELADCDPVVIHYHHLADSSGFIGGTIHPHAGKRIAEFNERLKGFRRKWFDNRGFWDDRYAEQPDHGSGLGSQGLPLIYKQQILKQTVQRLNPSSILDIGCGDQFLTENVPDDIYTGIDLSPVIIEQNRRKYPKRNYIAGDFLSESLPQFDLIISFDVTIHLDNVECYRTLVDRAISCTKDWGIISGYEGPPKYGSDITFYHEPLSATLKNRGAKNLKRLGEYGDSVIWYFDKHGNTGESDIRAVTQSNDPWSACGETFKPYFLVGCMRSGTTLLAELLGRHREIVYAPFELKEIWSKVGGVPMASPKTRDSVCPPLGAQHASPEQSLRLSQSFYDVYQKNLGNKNNDALFLNKNPHLCNKLFFVNELFKESKFIWIYRQLPDVVASLKRLFSSRNEKVKTWHYWPERKNSEIRCWNCFFGDELPEDVDPSRCFPGGDVRFLAEYWLENNSAVSDFFKSIPPGRTLVVKEEEAISIPEVVIARCLSFMETSLDTSIVEGYPIDNQRNGKWIRILGEEEKETLLGFVADYKQVIDQTFPEDHLSHFYEEQIAHSFAERARRASQNSDAENKDTYISDLKASLEEKDARIRNLEASVENKNATLNYIYHSYGLGALWGCNKMVDKLFPPNSKKRSLARLILKSIRR
jgi:2-polyprenyl-3-methyl-5-hydroxy-6-metoxy-1,4-benzoquinol methylase